jgi:transposase
MFRPKDPQQSLFGASMLLPEDKRKRLEEDWPGEFRRSALPLIDEERFRGLYCADNGRPNVAVQTIIGALLLKDMSDLTDAEAVGAVDYDLRWHVALDLEPGEAHVCQKTLHNFRVKLLASDEGRRLFEEVTGRILEALGVSADRQRLDSTHIMSNMAVLTRSCDSDDAATLPMVDDLIERNLEPKEMTADTTYGSTENVLACRERGIELVAPVAGSKVETPQEGELTAGDFEIDPDGKQKTRCPRGCPAESEKRNAKRGKVVAVFSASSCRDCPHAGNCPARRRKNGSRVLRTTLKKAALAQRRKYQNTEEFRERYAIRAGIEATNSELKRGHGLGRLRVRGFLRVRLAVYLKALACNVKRMVRHLAAKRKAAAKAALSPQNASETHLNVSGRSFRLSVCSHAPIFIFAHVA